MEAWMESNSQKYMVNSKAEPSGPLKPLRPVGFRYTVQTKRAMEICFDAHQNQKDKSGLPYIFHPFHLAEQMDTEEEICVALLHDVLEDSHYTMTDLKQAGFSEAVLEALQYLTHTDGVPYMDYVRALRKNPIARKVKQADLLHNSDLNRLEQVTEEDEQRRRKYRIALAVLEEEV